MIDESGLVSTGDSAESPIILSLHSQFLTQGIFSCCFVFLLHRCPLALLIFTQHMKRRPNAETESGGAGSPPKKQPRQDPVSCESCRKKKSKCDRGYPCGNCSMRKLECIYRTGGSGVVKAGSQTEERPVLDNIMVEPPRTLRRSTRVDTETQQRNWNEPLLTADWLETIVMGHRVPSAIPAPLRAELSQNQQGERSS